MNLRLAQKALSASLAAILLLLVVGAAFHDGDHELHAADQCEGRDCALCLVAATMAVPTTEFEITSQPVTYRSLPQPIPLPVAADHPWPHWSPRAPPVL